MSFFIKKIFDFFFLVEAYPLIDLKHKEHSRCPHFVCIGSFNAHKHTGHLYLSSNDGLKFAS